MYFMERIHSWIEPRRLLRTEPAVMKGITNKRNLIAVPATDAPQPVTRRQGPVRARPGFSLVEVMIAVMILGMVFAGVFAGMAQGFVMVENARDKTRASQILQSRMEELRSLAWDDITALPASTPFTITTEFTDEFADRYSTLQEISTPKAGMRLIKLTVLWTDQNGIAQKRIYQTYFTEGGLNDYYTRSF